MKRTTLAALLLAGCAVTDNTGGNGECEGKCDLPDGRDESYPYLMEVTPNGGTLRWESREPYIGSVHLTDEEFATVAEATEDAATTHHEVVLSGLTPNTLYPFYFGDGHENALGGSIRTAPLPESTDRVHFTVIGDLQWGQSDSQIPQYLFDEIQADDPDFVISVGDMVYEADEGLYSRSLQYLGEVLQGRRARLIPFQVAYGNHEDWEGGVSFGGDTLFDHFYSQPGDEHCFGYRWGSVFFMFLDTERPIEEQVACATKELTTPQATSALFRVGVFHKPPRIEYWNADLPFNLPWDARENQQILAELAPVLTRHGVDIVFSGHNHLYNFTPGWNVTSASFSGSGRVETDAALVSGECGVSPDNPITWVTTGGMTTAFDDESSKVAECPAIDTTIIGRTHYLDVTVERDAMTVKFESEGGPQHSFTIKRCDATWIQPSDATAYTCTEE